MSNYIPPYIVWSDDQSWLVHLTDILDDERIQVNLILEEPLTITNDWFYRMLNLAVAKKPKEFYEYRHAHLPSFDEYTDEERGMYGRILRTPKQLKFIESMRGKTIHRMQVLTKDTRAIKVIEQEALEKNREHKGFTGVWRETVYCDYFDPAMRYSLHATPLKDLKPSRKI